MKVIYNSEAACPVYVLSPGVLSASHSLHFFSPGLHGVSLHATNRKLTSIRSWMMRWRRSCGRKWPRWNWVNKQKPLSSRYELSHAEQFAFEISVTLTGGLVEGRELVYFIFFSRKCTEYPIANKFLHLKVL